MRIGALAELTGAAIETICCCEREGPIPAARRAENSSRRSTPTHAERLVFIRRCRNLHLVDQHDETVMFLFIGCWCSLSTVLFDVGKARACSLLPALPAPRKD